MTNVFGKIFNRHTNYGVPLREHGLDPMLNNLGGVVVSVVAGSSANTLVVTHFDGTSETITIKTGA